MKITSVETRTVSLPFTMGGPYNYFAGQKWDHLEILLVKVQTEDGLVGWGEAFGHACIDSTRVALENIVAPLVMGQDAREIKELSQRVLRSTHLLGRNGAHVFAYSGIEIALWDLAGKRAQQPIWKLLGGVEQESLPAYASLLTYSDPALVSQNVAQAVQKGYRYIKLHETTLEATRAAFKAPGAEGAKIMLDVNCAWLPAQACEIADSLKGDGLWWLEEPVWPPENLKGLAEVRRRGIPIAAGENVAGVYGFESLMDVGAIDIAQPSVTKIGGIGEVVQVIQLAKERGIKVQLHCPYFGPGLIASIHIAAALIEDPLVEILWMEMIANPFDPWVRTEDGRIKVPKHAGLGVEPDEKTLSQYTRGAIVRVT